MRIVLALAACVLYLVGGQCESAEVSTSGKAVEGGYIARLVSVEPSQDEEFVVRLHECYMPVWNQLRKEGIVTGVSVFMLTHYDSALTDNPPQEFLLLVQLGTHSEPCELLDVEEASACPERRDDPVFSVLRSAFMACTPNSCFGQPEPTYPDAASGIDFLIEFIGVEGTPSALAKYREIMSKYAGPANGILVERGMLHCFVALESINVLSDTPGAVPWNQVHISDDWDEGGDVNWNAVYETLFRTEFSCDQDSVWAELPPTDKSRADYHGRLISKLCVR